MPISSVFVAGALALSLVYYLKPQVNCADKLLPALARPALHGNTSHLIGNLVAFFLVSQSIQPRIGAWQYVILIGFLWLTTSLMDLVFKQKCSIGFSGIVLGLLVWDLFDRGQLKFDLPALGILLFLWLSPAASGATNISYSGHFYGILSGLIAVVLTRLIRPKTQGLVEN